jgi:hypothetical protein
MVARNEVHLMTAAKNDIVALELARQLDVKWDTASLIKQKLMEVMRQRKLDLQARRRHPDRRCLSGRRKARKTRAWSGQQDPFRHRRRLWP